MALIGYYAYVKNESVGSFINVSYRYFYEVADGGHSSSVYFDPNVGDGARAFTYLA